MKIVEFKDYDNQTTPLSAYNLNRLQQNLITTKYQMTFSSAVSGGSTITLPCYYQVGQDTLDVYLNSELLKKASTKDSEGHYYEVGNSDTKSNQIKITSDWSIASGDVLNLIVRGTTDSYDQNLSPDKATQLADEISANKEEITALQTENSRLKGITNALPKISGEDISLTLTNTANAPLSDIILKGNTSQNGEPTPATPQDIKVVTGDNTIKISNKNLLNGTHQTTTTVNGITITSNSDDTFDITGISTGEINFGLITNIDQSNLVVGKTYYFYMSEKYDVTNLNVSIITQTPSFHYWIANTRTTIQEGQKYNYIHLHIPSGVTMNYHNIKFMINEGSTAIDYVPNKQQVFPISLGSLELCKIGDYQDYFYKSGSIWYLHKEINKITSYNGETITTSYISTTGELSTGAKVYYVVTPTDTKITDTTLISQLNELEKAVSYDDTTNISQTNANLSFYLDVNVYTKTDTKLDQKQNKLIAGTGIEITGENIINNIQANYSTNEVRIGTWINGKPLYRKVVNAQFGTVVQGTETTVEVNLKNVDFVLVDKYWLDRRSVTSAINQGYAPDTLYLGYTGFSNSNTTLRFRTKQSWASNVTVYAIIIYTKTTD